MTTPDEDELWRGIVDNYGERPVLDEAPASDDLGQAGPPPRVDGPSRSPLVPGPEPTSPPLGPQRPGDFTPFTGAPDETVDVGRGDEGQTLDDELGTEDRGHGFVPPDPPLPEMDRRRWLAWIAVLGSPVAFVLAAIFNMTLNGLVAACLALTFVGGFVWLVASMPRDPGDPWDDGARV